MYLYFLLLGCKPKGRHIEQHDVFFGIGSKLKDFVESINEVWDEENLEIHIDSYRKVIKVGKYKLTITDQPVDNKGLKLYFVNLGSYKPQDIEEYHYKELLIARNLSEAKKIAKETVFFRHHTAAHIDDKYAIDVDDVYEVADLLSKKQVNQFHIQIREIKGIPKKEDKIRNGYFRLDKLK